MLLLVTYIQRVQSSSFLFNHMPGNKQLVWIHNLHKKKKLSNCKEVRAA